jgi:hypothetical protein
MAIITNEIRQRKCSTVLHLAFSVTPAFSPKSRAMKIASHDRCRSGRGDQR